MFYYIGCRQIVIFKQLGGRQIFFKGLRGAMKQERLKNAGLNLQSNFSVVSFSYQFVSIVVFQGFASICACFSFQKILFREKKIGRQ